jgi:hypothetical protein
MPSTPNFGWPTPEDTAQVANGPAIIRALGDAADATVFAQGTAIAAKNIPDFSDDVPTDGQVLTFDQAQGVYVPEDPTAVGAGFQFAGTVYFTSSGTFDKADPLGTGDIGLRAIRVRMVGGGGGAAGTGTTGANQASVASGGGGGSYSESFITDIAGLDATVTVTRGSAGGGGAIGANNGSPGGTSSFGTLVTAFGGGGGTARAPRSTFAGQVGAAGGAPGTGDFTVAGSGSTGALVVDATQGQASVNSVGGGSLLSGSTAAIFIGTTGLAFGGGAGGRVAVQNTTETSGADGATGIVIVDCFV